MKTVRVYLKGGQVVEFKCESYEISTNRMGAPTGLTTSRLSGEHIAYADMSEVAMVTEERT